MTIISFAEKQSWSSQTFMSAGVTFASSIATLTACCVISKPIRSMADRENREGASVARHWPAIRIACSFKCGRASKKSWDTRTAAAPPSEVGQHWSFVRGAWIMVEASICSKV